MHSYLQCTHRFLGVILSVLSIVSLSALSQTSKPVIREEISVLVDTVHERWRLEWRSTPQPCCDPSGEDWYICPCAGFAFGESGELDLVRQIHGKPEERLSLTPLFEDAQNTPLAVLPKWPVYDSDITIKDSKNLKEIVQRRPVVKIMKLADYDHDGRPTEFLLQIGAQACGHRQTVLVGISRHNPKLHIFGTIAHPNIPFILEHPRLWDAFLHSRGDTTVINWQSGDHGSDVEERIELHAGKQGIQAFRLEYSYDDIEKKVKLVKRDEL